MAEAASIGELVVSGISHVAWPATVLTLGLVSEVASSPDLRNFLVGLA